MAFTMFENIRAKVSQRNTGTVGMAYYYCSHNRSREERDEREALLRWIISQLCRQSNHVPSALRDMHLSGCHPNIKDLLGCLDALLASSPLTVAYVVIDAVDESEPWTKLVHLISELATSPRFRKLRLVVTSCEYPDILREFMKFSIPVPMKPELVTGDIKKYVDAQIERSAKCQRWPLVLRRKVAAMVPVNARGM
jgi:hypothetical protein